MLQILAAPIQLMEACGDGSCLKLPCSMNDHVAGHVITPVWPGLPSLYKLTSLTPLPHDTESLFLQIESAQQTSVII